MLCLFGIKTLMYSAPVDVQAVYSYRHYTIRDGLPGLKLHRVFQDAKGFIYIETDDGQFSFDGKRFLPADDSLKSIATKALPPGMHLPALFGNLDNPTDSIHDREGNIWVTTHNGLYNFFRLQFKQYSLPGDDMACSVVIDSQDRLWTGTRNSKLYRMGNDGVVVDVRFGTSPAGNRFYPFAVRQGNDLFFNSSSILRCRNERFWFLDTGNPERFLFVGALPGGNLVATHDERLSLMNPDGYELRSYTAHELRQSPGQAAADNDGRLWVAGDKGLTVISPEDIQFVFADSLRNSSLVARSPAGNVWFNAGNRIYEIVGDVILLRHTLNREAMRSLFFTRSGTLIVATIRGIYLYYPDQPVPAFYGAGNGMAATLSFATNMAEDSHGNVWLPASEGLITFNPSLLAHQPAKPLLHILDEQHSADKATFKYIGLCHSAPDAIKYRYRLLGLQDEWSEPVRNQEAAFHNLLPGRYTFQLKADTGTPGSETAIISRDFEILSPFWQANWFMASLFVLVCSLLAFIVYRFCKYFHTRRMNDAFRQLKLNELQIQSIHLRSMPHFDASVLSAIEYYMINYPREIAYNYLMQYSRFICQTLSDADKPVRTLRDELKYVGLFLELEKPQFDYDFIYNIDVDSRVDQDILIPTMAIHTYCGHAIRKMLSAKDRKNELHIKCFPVSGGTMVNVSADSAKLNVPTDSVDGPDNKDLLILSQQILLYNGQNRIKMTQRAFDLGFELFIPDRFAYS